MLPVLARELVERHHSLPVALEGADSALPLLLRLREHGGQRAPDPEVAIADHQRRREARAWRRSRDCTSIETLLSRSCAKSCIGLSRRSP